MAGDVGLGWLSLLPPALAIVLALKTRRVLVALFCGVLAANVVLYLDRPWEAPFRTLDHMVTIASDPGNFMLILFSLMVGGLLKLIREARGFEAFATALERFRKGYGRGTVFGTTYLLGVVLFLEVWSNVLINGTTMGTLYDRLRISRMRLAYFTHTIGINAVALLLINGWGAFYMSLLAAQDVDRPFEFLLGAIPYVLYSWISLALVAFVMITGFTIGPMKRFEERARRGETGALQSAEDEEAADSDVTPRLRYMFVPILTLLVTVLLSLWITGDGDITGGDGARSIVYAVTLSIVSIALLLWLHREFSLVEIEQKAISGMAEFFDVGILIVLALSLGNLTQLMGTGTFVAQLAEGTVPLVLIPALIFMLGAVMSFATGTSYGTFSIMVPIALPLATAMEIDPALMFGACLAGGLWGDNCSPISDTTIVTSIGANVPIVDHVRTQLPFALIAGGLTAVGYVLLAL